MASKIETLLIKFIKKFNETGKIDEKLRLQLINASTTWNKRIVIDDLTKRLNEFKMYNEMREVEDTEFPYKTYVVKLSQPLPTNALSEEDNS